MPEDPPPTNPWDFTTEDLEEIAAEQIRRNGWAPEVEPIEPSPDGRHLVLTPASTIPIRRARWLWEGRLAVGTLALLAGREGLGKSTLGYWLAAQVTRGLLPGEYLGTPKAVLVCATEDSWEVTILPRLLAAGADLSRVFRVEVMDLKVGATELVLPTDLVALGYQAVATDAALLLLDPLISRLGRANTHKDSETRQALEPVSHLAHQTRMAVLGLIHHSKATTDILGQVMGSRAFTAVARSVHSVVADLESEEEPVPLLFGTVKNNMGPGLPTLTFRLESVVVGEEDGQDISGSRVVWGGESETTVAEAHEAAREGLGGASAIREATTLLRSLMDSGGGCVTSKEAKKVAREEGVSERTLIRAAVRMRVIVEASGFPRTTTWTDPESLPPDSGASQ
jgi:hypothetical protein